MINSDIFCKPLLSPKDELIKDCVERLRKFIVFIDSCMEKGDLDKLDKELNKQVLYVLIQEGEKFDPQEFVNLIGSPKRKSQLRFGMNEPSPVEELRTNNRFKHHERKCLPQQNQQKI